MEKSSLKVEMQGRMGMRPGNRVLVGMNKSRTKQAV
jgi:hypothetical protein